MNCGNHCNAACAERPVEAAKPVATKSTRLTSKRIANDENASDFQPLAPAWREKRQAFLEQARLAKSQRPSSRETPVEVFAPAETHAAQNAMDITPEADQTEKSTASWAMTFSPPRHGRTKN